VSPEEFPDAFAPAGREAMESLRIASRDLAQGGAVRLQHQKDFPGERPVEIRLGPAEVVRAYARAAEAGYVPLDTVLEHLAGKARALDTPDLPSWMREFLQLVGTGTVRVLDVIGMRQDRVKREAQNVDAALDAITALSRGMTGWERVVSERIFGDSKRLGGIRSLVADLLQRADPRWRDLEPEDSFDILEAYGVRRKPGLLRCAGALRVEVNGHSYALEDFTPTAHLPDIWGPAWVEGILRAAPAVITTVENEFPFFSYVLEAGGPVQLGYRGELVVYTGGFPSVPLREGLATAAQQLKNTRFQHWGDADLGGIEIWRFLRSCIRQPLALFRTEAEWFLKEVNERGTQLSARERRGLQRVAAEMAATESGNQIDAKAVLALVAALLATGKKIEQERY
jgi:hypothetical protein